ncbi:protein of unknown function DUF1279 [Trinorchestia longiramus]|nr:protein of unknown function DUF1279 [Trinorchestia longiramus]
MALFPSTLNAVTSKLLLSNSVKLCHSSAGKLRIPPNLAEEAETQKIKFSPHRQRDTSAAHIAAKLNKTATGQVFRRGLDSSACRSVGSTFNAGSTPKDRRAPVYDQTNACSLSSVMQTNVPQPVKSDGRGERSGHLSMPGGQWSQNDKYISSDLHEHHYQKNSLSSKTKSQKKKTPSSSEVLPERGGSAQFECCFARLQSVSASNIAVSAAYANTVLDPAAYPLMLGECIVHSPMPGIPSVSVPVHHLDLSIPSSSAGYHRLCVRMPHRPLMFKFLSLSSPSVIQCHEFSSSSVTRNKDSTGTNLEANAPETSEQVLTSGQKIKRAVKEYGTAVIVFHVTISLASLGFFYLLVSR